MLPTLNWNKCQGISLLGTDCHNLDLGMIRQSKSSVPQKLYVLVIQSNVFQRTTQVRQLIKNYI